MDRVGIRELRNYTSEVVRRARAGERILVTVDGVPAAQITAIEATPYERDIQDLITAGLLSPRSSHGLPRTPRPLPAPGGLSSEQVLRSLRDR